MPNYAYDLPANYYFGGAGVTFFTPLSLAALIMAIILIVCLPRQYVVVPFLLGAILIPDNNELAVFGLNFQANRLLMLAGWARLWARREWTPFHFNALDKVVIAGALVNSIAYSLVWREFGAVVNRLGFLFAALGTYLLLRTLIRSREDIVRVIKVFAVVVTVLAPLLWYEHTTGHNAFFPMGAASQFPSMREDRMRAAGPFGSAINAGTFGVVLVPLFFGLWRYRIQSWFFAAVGVISSVVMLFASSSSTPVMAFPAGILALGMWPLRKAMRTVRWLVVALLIGLQVSMKTPIWHLLSKTGGLLGGSGYHRAMLIEYFVYHFFDWFLIGTRDNANWGWDMWDVDDAYVGAGLTGGLTGLILFLCIFIYGYRMIGAGMRGADESPGDASLIWAVGSALFANSLAFLGIVYFDQSVVGWYVLLVMISVVTTSVVTEQTACDEPEIDDPSSPEPLELPHGQVLTGSAKSESSFD